MARKDTLEVMHRSTPMAPAGVQEDTEVTEDMEEMAATLVMALILMYVMKRVGRREGEKRGEGGEEVMAWY